MAAINAALSAATGRPSTRRFQTLLAGKIGHWERPGIAAGVGAGVGAAVDAGGALVRAGCEVGLIVGRAVGPLAVPPTVTEAPGVGPIGGVAGAGSCGSNVVGDAAEADAAASAPVALGLGPLAAG